MRNRLFSFCRAAVYALLALVAMTFNASAYTIVTESSGELTFAPSGLVTPILTGAIAAVGAGAALVVLGVGVRWIYRAIKAR